MNEQTRFNLSELISGLARIGRNDPTIAAHLGISVSTVRDIRREYGIPAAERRWLGNRPDEAAGTTAGRGVW
jgi:hypothetical protein